MVASVDVVVAVDRDRLEDRRQAGAGVDRVGNRHAFAAWHAEEPRRTGGQRHRVAEERPLQVLEGGERQPARQQFVERTALVDRGVAVAAHQELQQVDLEVVLDRDLAGDFLDLAAVQARGVERADHRSHRRADHFVDLQAEPFHGPYDADVAITAHATAAEHEDRLARSDHVGRARPGGRGEPVATGAVPERALGTTALVGMRSSHDGTRSTYVLDRPYQEVA